MAPKTEEPRPIWYSTVPRGFWSRSANRRAFVEWLGRKFGFEEPEDWYALTRKAVIEHGGGTMLAKYYDGSVITLLRHYMHWHDWKEWLFPLSPMGFWKDHRNHRPFLEWMGEQLGYEEMDDWYQVNAIDFHKTYGASILKAYRNSPTAVVLRIFREYPWQTWKFEAKPWKYWKDPENGHRYMSWLGQRLGFEKTEDWYGLNAQHFVDNYGSGLLQEHGKSPLAVLKAHFPDYEWQEWRFDKVPNRFWKSRANRLRCLEWMGEQMGIQEPEDWYRVTGQDFIENRCSGVMVPYECSPYIVLKNLKPEYDWKEWLFSRVSAGFWDDRKNRRRFLDWFAEEIGIKDPQDWLDVGQDEFLDHGGITLLANYHYSVRNLLLDTFPRRGRPRRAR